jgi:hypothetical protein
VTRGCREQVNVKPAKCHKARKGIVPICANGKRNGSGNTMRQNRARCAKGANFRKEQLKFSNGISKARPTFCHRHRPAEARKANAGPGPGRSGLSCRWVRMEGEANLNGGVER